MAWLVSIAVAQGRRAGLAATFGVALGLVINAGFAAVGLAALAAANPLIWSVLRYAGTTLMLWLAWEAWRDSSAVSAAKLTEAGGLARYFRAGLGTNILNPKAFLFYAAVLPQFLPATAGSAPAALLALIAVAVATSIHLAIVTTSSQASRWLDQPRRLRLVRQLLALSLVGVAIWMFIGSAPPS